MSSPLPSPVARLILVVATLLLGAACRSTSIGSGEMVRMTLRDYRSGHQFEIAGESHTNRVEYYSHTRTEASRKVVPDEIAAALADELGRRGFEGHRKAGRAPSQGGSVLSWGLEVASSAGVEHWVVGPGTERGEQLAFQEARKVFLELYNATTSWQTVENDKGRSFFEGQGRPAGARQ